MRQLCDMHTHTVFCDGKDTPEEMVRSAVNKGCKLLGFSGHAYSKFPNAEEWCMSREGQLEYAAEINRLKLKYADKIKIMLGAEMDFFSEPLNFECDYIIGSVHAVKKNGVFFDVDHSPEELSHALNEYYSGDTETLVRDYYSLVADIVTRTDCDIIGHFDLVTKFNEKMPIIDTQSKKYQSIALEALDALIESNRIFEINTGAMSRGWKTHAYPEGFILRRLSEKGAQVMLNSDAHSAENIMYAFDETAKFAIYCGIENFVSF